MKTLVLSDHTNDQIQAAQTQREQRYEEAQRKYQEAVKARQDSARALRDRALQSWARRAVFTWLVLWGRWLLQTLSSSPKAPLRPCFGRDEAVWAAGSAGEQRVERYFSERLDDSFTLVSGYRNQGGEIDQLLVGPRGITALEIKYVNGTVHCQADTWWRDKFDRYGNLVETGVPIADKNGRGPSTQVNAAADRLHNFLACHGVTGDISRVVVLSHAASRLGKLSQLTVDLVATVQGNDLASWVLKVRNPKASLDVAQILALIQQDHHHHNRKGGAKTGGHPRQAANVRPAPRA